MRRLLPVLPLVAGCGTANAPQAGDTAATSSCDTGSPVAWESGAAAAFSTWCQPCHAQDAPQRYGAPEAVVFDTEADALPWAGAVRRTALIDETMPVGGGLSPEARATLAGWLCEVGA